MTGGIGLGPDARVDGGIHVNKNVEAFHSGSETLPCIVVGPGLVVGSRLKFERPVKLYVSDQARVGPLEGATAIPFSGERQADLQGR